MTNLTVISGIQENTLGDEFIASNGVKYIYCKAASGTLIKACSALTIDEDGVAVGSITDLINGIAQAYDVDARSENKYFWAMGIYCTFSHCSVV